MNEAQTRTKYLLYAFKCKKNQKYSYWYETDNKYFKAKKPPESILDKNIDEIKAVSIDDIILNPWNEWDSNNTQKIITDAGVCINYLKSTDNDYIQKQEDLKLLELYSYLVDNFDISRSFGFNTVKKWHKEVFSSIYPFAGELRSVNMSKGNAEEAWVWRVDFLNAIPELNEFIKEVSKKRYEDIDNIAHDLSKLISDFLFIHPFREGNGRISRVLCDMILAKNGLPMIGLKLKKEDNYIQRVHSGYDCDYEPMKDLLKMKIEEEITSE
ncbi:Fic/DOC family protein [Sulfurimonas sp.]|uniref:Fic/DOC family protein n=1 Tax=Sulfurimonas sp. TaxID=2022749 RepID=UPI002B47DFD8|nr:Fic family protein [Sulfurimonas sp.]